VQARRVLLRAPLHGRLVRLLSLGQGMSRAEHCVACEFQVETMTQNIVMYVYFNTSQIKSVYALLEETRSFSSS
jgi:hypothetical protein